MGDGTEQSGSRGSSKRRRSRALVWAKVAAFRAAAAVAPAAIATSIALTPSIAAAASRPKVEWKRIEVPEGPSADRYTRVLKALLVQAAKKADFGEAKNVVATAKLVEFTAEERGDVLRLTCTIVGRIVGGPGARSRISFGGSPAKRAELEKQVLGMVSNGVVTRLAEIARSRAIREREANRESR